MGFTNFYPYTDFNELNLDWILKQVKEHSDFFENDYPDLLARIKADEYRIEVIEKWISDYDVFVLQSVLSKYFHFAIFLEISESGYIIYNIPESWQDITFETTGIDVDIPNIDYGHLVLAY